MTRREAAIITAYTGVVVGYFEDFEEYVQELLGRSVGPATLSLLEDKIKQLSYDDFMNIEVN